MTPELGPLLNILGTLAAALVAGAISYFAGKGMKKHEWKLELLKEKIFIRRQLCANFLAEADRQVLQSIKEKTSDIVSFSELTKLHTQIQMISSQDTIKAAQIICDYVLESHACNSDDKRNFPEMKQKFIAAAKKEISSLEDDL